MPVLSTFKLLAIAAVLAGVAFITHQIDELHYMKKENTALADQQKVLEDKCQSDKLITKGAQDALSKANQLIDADLNDDRLYPATCIQLPVASAANPPASGGGHAAANGLSPRWLRVYAADCKRYQQQRVILEGFTRQTWKANGQ